MSSTSHAMNFFEHQDRAKANTRRFVLMYICAVILICLAVSAVIALIALFTIKNPNSKSVSPVLAVAAVAAAITALLIILGSLHRIAQLRGGGSVLAHSLGGRLIEPSSKDPGSRQVLNIVEEMSIASGVPVPPVYLMPGERGINAFAAGYAPGDAVIGVTKGCVDGLTRDELQGVIAHEFSHILNGDMRLNIRMIGMLNGIVLLSVCGYIMLRATPRSARGKEGTAVILGMFTLSVAMIAIGGIGALSARIIQASVSRQREFLADASAVQFTRNPAGIANALRRIGGYPKRARVLHPRAQEAGHMFFGKAVGSSSLRSTLSSHPPLKERIIRIDPSWDGTMLEPLAAKDAPSRPQESPRQRLNRIMPGARTPGMRAGVLPESIQGILPLLALSGTMTPAHISHARDLILEIPQELKDAAHDTFSGRAVVYALLLDRKDAAVHESQIKHLETSGDPAIADLVQRISASASTMKPELRLPLLDMTLGSLAQLSQEQHTSFRANIEALIQMDRAVDLFEWVTIGVIKRHLDERFGLAKPQVIQYYKLTSLGHETSVLLSVLAHASAKDPDAATKAFELGSSTITGIDLHLLSKDQSGLDPLAKALPPLASCSNRIKQSLLRACAVVIGADREITTTEAELLRAIADTLGIPTPPLLPGQRLV